MPHRNGVVLDPVGAGTLIAGYKQVLLQLEGTDRRNDEDILRALVRCRHRATEDRMLLERAIDECRGGKQPVNQEVLAAIRTLKVDNWVYLRDTKNYSVFVHGSGDFALGVVGLTQPIRDIVGTSGAAIEFGVVRYQGLFACDGLVSRIVQLGPSFRRSFSDAYRILRMEGKFEAQCMA
jgi:hypothetical protein